MRQLWAVQSIAFAHRGWVKCQSNIVTETVAATADSEDVSINNEKSDPAVRRTGGSEATQRVGVQRRRWQRMARTILLGTTTALAGVVWVAQQYGVAVSESLAFLGASFIFVLGLIGIALAAACLLWLLRWVLRR